MKKNAVTDAGHDREKGYLFPLFLFSIIRDHERVVPICQVVDAETQFTRNALPADLPVPPRVPPLSH